VVVQVLPALLCGCQEVHQHQLQHQILLVLLLLMRSLVVVPLLLLRLLLHGLLLCIPKTASCGCLWSCS
jgi:hypothetical protein